MPIAQRRGHKLGEEIRSPAYLDANFLVFYTVGARQAPDCQTVARNVMGDMLVQRITILVSLVSVEETLWGTLQEFFCRHIWRPVATGERCRFDRRRARSNWTRLIHYRADLEMIVGNLKELRDRGADIRFVPESEEAFHVFHNVPTLMEKHSLFSADALHLSLALSQAKTFITFDVHDFENVVDPAQDLTIMLLPS